MTTWIERLSATAEWESDVCIFQGAGRHDVIDEARAWLGVLAGRPGVPLVDLAFTLSRRLRSGTLRLAIVAATLPELMSRLESAADLLADPTQREISDPRGVYFAEQPMARRGRLAFVFPGDGSPYLNMLSDLAVHFECVRRWFELADRMAREVGRRPYTEVLFPGPLSDPRERWRAEHALRRMDNSGSIVLAANIALFTLLEQLGIRPDALIGHSLGDWSALGAAGVLSVPEFLRHLDQVMHLPQLVTRAGARMALAIGERERVEEVLAGVGGEVYVAMHNGPRRVVIAGAKAPVREALDRLAGAGVPTYRLPFVRAAHTPMSIGVCEPMASAFGNIGMGPPATELWSCSTARPYPPDPAEIRRIAVDNIIRPVEFVRTIEHAHAAGIRSYLECGAGGQLADCVTDILGDRPHLAVAADLRQRRGVTQLNHLVGSLAAHGVDLRLDALFADRSAELIELPPRPAPSPARAAVPAGAGAQIGWFLRETAGAMESHLAAMRATLAANTAFTEQFIATQRDVLSAYYQGSAPTEVAEPATSGELAWPFVDEVVELVPGRRAVLRHRLDPARQPYLLDHQIGVFATHDAETAGAMPLVPLTVTVEMMAEAARMVYPDRPLRGGRKINARREISGEDCPTLEFRAETIADGEVKVEVFAAGSEQVLSDGELLFGPLAEPPAPTIELTGAAPAPLSAEALYDRHIMFHGPCFQGVSETGVQSADGLIGRLRSLPRGMMLGRADEPPMLLDPALLDAMGQLFGYWPLAQLDDGVIVFPAQIQEFELFGPPPAPGDEVEMRLTLDEVRAKRLVGSIELVRDGAVLVKVSRWTFWRFNWPAAVVRFVGHPARFMPTAPLAERFPGLDLSGLGSGLFAMRRALDLPLWIARATLTRDEFRTLRRTSSDHRQQDQFLAGRLAAKDAVRRWRIARGLDGLEPNQIAIEHDAEGAPLARPRDGGPAPHLSLAHKPGIAVAVAGDQPVGIDVEPIAARDAAFLRTAFAADELAELPDATAQTAAWTAKEAVAKQLGRGLTDPKQFRARPSGPGTMLVDTPSCQRAVRWCGDGQYLVAVASGGSGPGIGAA